MTKNRVRLDSFHYFWDNSHKPIILIQPGEKVRFDVNEVTSWQIGKKSKIKDLQSIDEKKIYPLTGPVYVEGASSGDALQIEILEVNPDDWGWSAIMPGLGLLPEFNRYFLWMWDLSKKNLKGGYVPFKNGIKVPFNPFCGVMGVAPKENGEFKVLPPGVHGGNLDIKHLTAGSKLILPVWRDGALFSVGDMHAAQGDGEVCVTAIECPGKVTLKFDLIKKAEISFPRFMTPKKDIRYNWNLS